MTKRKAQHDSQQACYCGNEARFEVCCGPCIDGTQPAQNAEQLMRSRYSAFVRRNEAYLLSTWHPQSRPSRVRFEDDLDWLGLRIKACVAGGEDDERGTVEFVARFRQGARGHRLHEISEFRRLQGRWYYLSGEHLT